MRLIRLIITIAAGIFCLSCSATGYSQNTDPESPYGLWSTERGHVIIVTRDDKYTFCSVSECMFGIAKPIWGGTAAELQDFFKHPATLQLRMATGVEKTRELTKDDPVFGNNHFYQLKTGNIPKSMVEEICQGRTCSVIGRIKGQNIHRFIKMEDY